MLRTSFARLACWVWLFVFCATGMVVAEPLRVNLMFDGLERSYLVDLPDPLPVNAGVMLALSDAASSGLALRELSDLSEAAHAAGMIAVYPDPFKLIWDSGKSASDYQPETFSRDDVGFLKHVIAEVVQDYGAYAAEVNVVGFGDGGAMAFELACKAPETVKGVAVVAALLWRWQREGCGAATAPPSLLMIHGSEDRLGQDLFRPGTPPWVLSSGGTLEFWAEELGCDREQVQTTESLRRYEVCSAGAQLALVTVHGANHHWMRRDRHVNATNMTAEEIIFAFFTGSDWAAALPERAELASPAPGRSYHVYVPPGYDPAEPTPVVMALHGRPSSGLGMAFITDFNPVAEQEGFIAVYPEYAFDSWNYTEGLPGYDNRGRPDDVAFLKTLAQELALDLNVDPDRLYLTGFSNGGFMTARAACGASDTFAAFAIVGATVVPELYYACQAQPPAPILYIHGTDDASVLWREHRERVGGQERVMLLSAVDSFVFWASRNQCGNTPIEEVLPQLGNSPETVVRRITLDGCLEDVEFYPIQGGGHNWPGVPGRIGESIAGRVNEDIHASELIWDFFRAHPLKP